MTLDINARAWALYQDIQRQRAVLKTYDEAVFFVRVRQSEAPQYVEPLARKLWEIAERARGDMDVDWSKTQ